MTLMIDCFATFSNVSTRSKRSSVVECMENLAKITETTKNELIIAMANRTRRD